MLITLEIMSSCRNAHFLHHQIDSVENKITQLSRWPFSLDSDVCEVNFHSMAAILRFFLLYLSVAWLNWRMMVKLAAIPLRLHGVRTCVTIQLARECVRCTKWQQWCRHYISNWNCKTQILLIVWLWGEEYSAHFFRSNLVRICYFNESRIMNEGNIFTNRLLWFVSVRIVCKWSSDLVIAKPIEPRKCVVSNGRYKRDSSIWYIQIMETHLCLSSRSILSGQLPNFIETGKNIPISVSDEKIQK